MKKQNIIAAVLSLALFTACNSGQSVQTSETVSETEASVVTTTSAKAVIDIDIDKAIAEMKKPQK